MKKLICLALALALAAGMLGGCAAQKESSVFTADNEIFTYQKIDPERTQIVVSRTGNITVEPLCEEFERLNGDVQVICLDITGGNADYKPLEDWVIEGYRPDVVISAAGFISGRLTPEYFENLSADPIIQNYEASALQRTAIDGEIYMLPGPSDISAIMYNKTLFEEYGWQVPATFDEFVALCDRITADTGGEIEPWNPNAKYDMELLTALEAIAYEELFGGADNRAWYNAFIEGNAAFTGHMEPYFEAVETLVRHGILREEHFSYSATARGKEFTAGKIAMINAKIYDGDTDEFDFGFMPFPGTKGELGYLSNSYSCFVGLPIKEHTDKEQDAIDRFIAFFSSPEGQQVYIGSSMKVSNVKGMALNGTDDLAALQSAISAGHMFAPLEFNSPLGEARNFSLHTLASEIAAGTATPASSVASVDKGAYSPAQAPAAPAEAVATAEDMTALETSFYIADMYREKAGADIGLIAHGVPFRGNLMRIFAGDITEAMVTVLKPRSFANDSALVKVSMTGAQLLDALNHPLGDGEAQDCIYAYSGLKCELAPWNMLGSKYLSVALADGGELEPDKLYTVACWQGTVAEEYITETLESYEGTWEELMSAKLAADGSIAPAADGRASLVWK